MQLNIVDRASDNTIGGRSKKHSQASPTEAMGHPTGGQRRLRSQHGGRPGGLPEATRSGSTHRLPGRDDEATHQGNACPVPAQPGQPARHDYEYERNGTANLFMLFAPLEGWRHVEVTDRHAALSGTPHHSVPEERYATDLLRPLIPRALATPIKSSPTFFASAQRPPPEWRATSSDAQTPAVSHPRRSATPESWRMTGALPSPAPHQPT